MKPDLVVAQTDNRFPWRMAMSLCRLLPQSPHGWFVVTNGPSPEMTPARASEWFRLLRRRKAQLVGYLEGTKCGNIG